MDIKYVCTTQMLLKHNISSAKQKLTLELKLEICTCSLSHMIAISVSNLS